MDLNRFRFDYDLTFALLAMSPEGETLARYGTMDGRGGAGRMSVPGLKAALRAVLADYRPARVEAAPPAEGPRTLQDIPVFRKRKAAGDACYHCHYAADAEVAELRAAGRFFKARLYRFPHPENLGVTLDADRANVVGTVLPMSPAESAGVRAGDRILRAEGTRVYSAADLQWALDPLPDPGRVTLRLERDGKALAPVVLKLDRGWRKTDISWRPSQGMVPPILGIWEKPLDPGAGRPAGVPAEGLALQVNFLFPEPKWAPTRGDLRLGDVIIGLEGQPLPAMTPRQFHAHFRMAYEVGQTASLDVVRGGRRIQVRVPCLDVGEE